MLYVPIGEWAFVRYFYVFLLYCFLYLLFMMIILNRSILYCIYTLVLYIDYSFVYNIQNDIQNDIQNVVVYVGNINMR